MLDPRWRKVWRDAALHKARTLLVVIAIAVGLAASGTVLSSWALVQRVTRESFLASAPVSATIRTDSVDERLLGVVRRVRGVRAARARRTLMASLRAQGTWQSAMLFASTDYTKREMGKLESQAGAWPPPDGAIVVERSSVDVAGIAIGEPASVSYGDGQAIPVPVTGIVRDVSVAPGWMEHIVYGFVTPQTLAMLGAPSTLNEIQILVDDAGATQDQVRAIAYDVKSAVESAGHAVRDIEVPVPGEHIHAAQMDSLLYTQGAFGLLALVVCGFLVVNLVAAMLASQGREIGVMKTLGAQPRQLAQMYLAYAGTLGIAAAMIAVPIAARLGRSYAALKADLLNFSIVGFTIPWWAIALQAAVGVLVPIIAAWIPVRRACRVSVAAALRDVGIGATVSGWLPKVPGISRPALLSIRNAFRKRERMVLTLLALATAGAVFLGAANLRRSVLGAVDLLYSSQKFDFSVRLSSPHDADSAEAIVRRVGGVSGVEGWAAVRATVAHAGGLAGNAFSIVGPPLASSRIAPRMAEGRWLRAGDGRSLVVSRSLAAREPSIQVGEKTTLIVGGESSEWLIVGTIETGPAPTAYTTRETIGDLNHDSRISTLVVASTLSGVGAQVDLIQRVRSALDRAGMSVTGSQLIEETRRVMQDHLLMVVQFLAAMGWVMLAVGGMGLASTMSLAVLERTREIGVMRAIGARHGAILRMVELEGIVIGLASWLCAIPLSIPMSLALARAFSRVMLEVPTTYAPNLTGVSLWLALVIVVSLVASAWPAIRAGRVSVARALAYE